MVWIDGAGQHCGFAFARGRISFLCLSENAILLKFLQNPKNAEQ